jgi:DNA repair protein RadC
MPSSSLKADPWSARQSYFVIPRRCARRITGVRGDVLLRDPQVIQGESIPLCHSRAYPEGHECGNPGKEVVAGKLMNISILDHIIIGDDNHFSFANAGMI